MSSFFQLCCAVQLYSPSLPRDTQHNHIPVMFAIDRLNCHNWVTGPLFLGIPKHDWDNKVPHLPKSSGQYMGLNVLLCGCKTKLFLPISCHRPLLWPNLNHFHPRTHHDRIFVWFNFLNVRFINITPLQSPLDGQKSIDYWLERRILTKPWQWLKLKGQVFSLGSASALILIEFKAIRGPFKKHPVGAPLVFSPCVTWALWSISSTWTIHPLSYLNLISRLISIVSPAWVTKLFTQKEPIASSGKKKGLQRLP